MGFYNWEKTCLSNISHFLRILSAFFLSFSHFFSFSDFPTYFRTFLTGVRTFSQKIFAKKSAMPYLSIKKNPIQKFKDYAENRCFEKETLKMCKIQNIFSTFRTFFWNGLRSEGVKKQKTDFDALENQKIKNMIGVTIHPPPTTTPSTHHQHPTPYSPYCNVQARGSRLARIFYSPARIQCIFCSHQVTPHNYAFFVCTRFTSNTTCVK